MNIEELNERIEQLTNLIITSEETISQLNETLKSVEQERDRLADERRELEPKFERVEQDEYYYSIKLDAVCTVFLRREDYWDMDDKRYNLNNYFHSSKRAQEVADKIRFLLKLERLHDIYCPDYSPNWKEENNEHKYCVYYDNVDGKYCIDWWTNCIYQPTVYFPTETIAQQVCDRLNKEREEHDNS